ncbi:head protein [Citrobacter sp. HN-141]|uniref:antirestriction phage head protein DarA n=1 Tax=unclassified Citrobacter TaxID=2644389 RepID=UPI002964F82E|nr:MULTISPECIES: head protein [unclassified Citrobacter]MDW2645985.1 head protein [Citrobacter sp. HN-141]MDW2655517.1 head protein [Citrobacter sp. HN-120]MDW2698542.1 head protein [Citrobacter sp. HN-144]
MTVILTDKILLKDVPGYIAPAVSDDIYNELMKGQSADLMLESATIEEVDQSYLGDELVYVSHAAMFEAISTERMRLSQTMRAFVRALNRGLNGTDIKAGTDDAGLDDSGEKTIGGAVIGKVRRVNSIPIMTALIPLSDGQSISLVFHSPTADNGRVKNNDLLVAFRFLLNKRDVTHIVAPIGGRDVSLQQVTQALANLAERNSAKFTKQQDAQVKLRSDIDALNAENDQLSEQQSSLLTQVESLQTKLITHQSDERNVREKLANQRRINAELEAKIVALRGVSQAGTTDTGSSFTDATRKVKERMGIDGKATLSNGAIIRYNSYDHDGELQGSVIITDPSGKVYEMPSPSSQGGAMGVTATKLLKAYRENRADRYVVTTPPPELPPEQPPEQPPELPPEQPPVPTAKYRYALTSRPASIGSVPADHTAILDVPEQSDKYGRLARHGFIEYDRKLTEQEASNFELKLIPTEADLDVLAKTVVSDSMANYAQQYVEMAESDPATFGSQVKLNTKKAAPNIAYPEGDDLDYFMEKVKAELVSQTPPTPPQTNEETPVVSEADTAANDALSYLDAVMQLQSKDIAEIRDARNKVRGAIAALQNAGRFDENEDKVNAAAQHLSDLLVAIQREGAGA